MSYCTVLYVWFRVCGTRFTYACTTAMQDKCPVIASASAIRKGHTYSSMTRSAKYHSKATHIFVIKKSWLIALVASDRPYKPSRAAPYPMDTVPAG